MSGEQFDSGAVLSRARPVLTFASVVRGDAQIAGAEAESLPSARGRLVTPTPSGMSLPQPIPAGPQRRSSLPVIARIVRRTSVRDRVLEAPVQRAAWLLRKSGLGALVVGALGLATLGVIAGFGMRSLSDQAPITAASTPAAADYDATATERLLARAPLAPRVDRAGTSLTTEAPQPVSRPAAAPPPAAAVVAPASHPVPHLAPPHRAAPSRVVPRAFAAAHKAHAAAKHASTTAVARR